MQLLVSKRRTDIFRIDEFSTIYVKKDNTMFLGLSDNGRTVPIGDYKSAEEAREALKIVMQRIAGEQRIVYVPTDEEVVGKAFFKDRSSTGKKAIRRGGS